MALQNIAANWIDSPPVEFHHSAGQPLTAMSAVEKYVSPNEVRLNLWLTQSEVIIPFTDSLRKDLILTSYLMDEWGCFSPCICLARAVLKVLNYSPITPHFQETG